MSLEYDRSIIGSEFDRVTSEPVTVEHILEYIAATGEIQPPATPAELVAPPTYVVCMRRTQHLPPQVGKLRFGFDAGKDIQFGVPIRPGDVLTSVTTVHDIYEKTGRSGTMAFVVVRTVVTNQRQEQVAVVDQQMMCR